MKVWRLLGRSAFSPPPPDWRAALASRLGQRPRRIGPWAELALYGALACLDDAAEKSLPPGALLSLSSLSGPQAATLAALETARHELPMPIGFLQSQPGQVLPVLAQHLDWSGNGRVLTTRDPRLALQLASLDADDELLLGWVDETMGGRSLWLRATLADAANVLDAARRGGHDPAVENASFDRLFDPAVTIFRFTADGRLRLG